MSKAIICGSVIIGCSIIATPFVYDYVKEREREKPLIARERSEITILDMSAETYREKNGVCPNNQNDLIGLDVGENGKVLIINRILKDRYGMDYETDGNCKFHSISGEVGYDI